MPVSYKHLDVYKRQQLKSSLQYSNQVQFFTERFSVNQFYFNLGLNIKMTEQLFFEISNKYLSFFSTSRLKSDLYLTGFDICLLYTSRCV